MTIISPIFSCGIAGQRNHCFCCWRFKKTQQLQPNPPKQTGDLFTVKTALFFNIFSFVKHGAEGERCGMRENSGKAPSVSPVLPPNIFFWVIFLSELQKNWKFPLWRGKILFDSLYKLINLKNILQYSCLYKYKQIYTDDLTITVTVYFRSCQIWRFSSLEDIWAADC